MRVAGLSSLAKKEITLYGQKFTMAALDAEEQAILEDNYNKLLGTTDSQVRRIFEERADTIVAGIMAIKEKLENRKFRGMNPGDAEIGFGFIRPHFTREGGDDAGDERDNWAVTYAAIGEWVNYLSGGAVIPTPFTLSEDHGFIITHLVSQVFAPFTREVQFRIGRVTLIPEDVSDLLIGDNLNGVSVFPIPTKIVLPEDELSVTANGEVGTDHLKLGGLVVGMGRLLKATNPEW